MTRDWRKTYQYEDLSKGQCVAKEDGIRCDRGVRNKATKLCGKHYARFQRHGSTENLRFSRSVWQKDPKRAAYRRRKRAAERSGRTYLLAQGKQPCFCIHRRNNHVIVASGAVKKCTVLGCDCKEFDEVPIESHLKATTKMANLGFINPLGKYATCARCLEVVNIGHWTDPLFARRAALHMGKECTALRRNNLSRDYSDRTG